MRLNKMLLSAALVSVLAPTASAQLIASDSYKIGSNPANGEYVVNTSLGSQPATLVTTGFATGAYTGGSGTSQYTATATGLAYAATGVNITSTDSGKVNYNAAPLDTNIRVRARNLISPVPTSSTYWLGYMVNRGNIPQAGGTGFALTGFGNSVAPVAGASSGDMTGLFVGFAQDGIANNFGSLVIRYRSAAAFNSDEVLINGATSNTFGTTYFVVMKLEVNVSGASDRVTYWLNPGDFTSEAQLSATSFLTGTFNGLVLSQASDFSRLNYSARAWNGNVFFDEPRLGLTLADTFGVQAQVNGPEPGTLALFGVGMIGLLARIRRRK